jgi:hypothetical protein
MKNVEKYEIIDHGVENSDYFQGCGVSFTEFESVYTGTGDTPAEALDDALGQASCEYNTEAISNNLSDDSELSEDMEEVSEIHHFVSIRLK